MIYRIPQSNEPIDQGDLLDDCPIPAVTDFSVDRPDQAKIVFDLQQVIVLTQTCDLANAKGELVAVASVFDAQKLIELSILKTSDVKGPIRAGRVWGLYFLPAHPESGLGEMIVDLRRLYSVRHDILRSLASAGRRRAQSSRPTANTSPNILLIPIHESDCPNPMTRFRSAKAARGG